MKNSRRKRHIAVDTDGWLLMINVTAADISDSASARQILDAIRTRWSWISIFADARTTAVEMGLIQY